MLKRVLNILLAVLGLTLTAQGASAERPRSSPSPDISLAARGVVQLDLDDATGKVVRVRMLQSTGYPVLDQATMKVYSKKQFKPHTRSPLNVPARFSVRRSGP